MHVTTFLSMNVMARPQRTESGQDVACPQKGRKCNELVIPAVTTFFLEPDECKLFDNVPIFTFKCVLAVKVRAEVHARLNQLRSFIRQDVRFLNALKIVINNIAEIHLN